MSPQAYQRTVAGLKNAYDNKVPLTFSTDADYWVAGQDARRAVPRVPEDVEGRRHPERRHPARDDDQRLQGERDRERRAARSRPGFFADLIAVPGNPLDDLDALKNVQFVMKDGQVFKRDGVMTPAAFFHGGPVNGWRIR